MKISSETFLSGVDARHEEGALEHVIDMAISAMALHAIKSKSVDFAFQPICRGNNLQEVLYQEVLIRLREPMPPEFRLPAKFIPSVERLGLMTYVDRYVVRHALDLLLAYPEQCLGVNISAQSAGDQPWWNSILIELAAEPSVAKRLVVEITETEPVNQSKARPLIDRLRTCGCRVAIDDFGVGYSVESAAIIDSVDIVKIAGPVFGALIATDPHGEKLARLVAFAHECAPCVVVEGVESQQMLELANRAGAGWVQGYHVTQPHYFIDPGYTCEWDLEPHEPTVKPQGDVVPLIRIDELSRILRQVQRLENRRIGFQACLQRERAASLLQTCVEAILDKHLAVSERRQAKSAYAAGLSGGVYGKHSAVASGLRSRLADILHEAKHAADKPKVDLLIKLTRFGRIHGAQINQWLDGSAERIP